MKKILIFCVTLLSMNLFGQNYSDVIAEKMTLEKWNEEAKSNIRLWPKYRYAVKTEDQKKADQEFIANALAQDSSNRIASDHMIDLGFSYLYRDIKTAMYRFNQAYLLDSTNTDIYWGFGGVYLTLGDYEKAEKQYLEGLAINPNNTHLLTDYGTYFMIQYYSLQPVDEKEALTALESAISYMLKSFQLDPSDQNTTFKLSVGYFNQGNCENAWKYYNICQSLGGKPITKEYSAALKGKCKQER